MHLISIDVAAKNAVATTNNPGTRHLLLWEKARMRASNFWRPCPAVAWRRGKRRQILTLSEDTGRDTFGTLGEASI